MRFTHQPWCFSPTMCSCYGYEEGKITSVTYDVGETGVVVHEKRQGYPVSEHRLIDCCQLPHVVGPWTNQNCYVTVGPHKGTWEGVIGGKRAPVEVGKR